MLSSLRRALFPTTCFALLATSAACNSSGILDDGLTDDDDAVDDDDAAPDP